jgi:hypothetical protein
MSNTPTGNNTVLDIVKERHIHLHVLQTPVVLLPGYNVIIVIIYITAPVTTVTITPAGDNNIVDSISVDLTFCLPSILTASQKITLL